MPIPKEIIDNSPGNKLVDFLNARLKESPKTNLDIGTAYFNVRAFAMVKDSLNSVQRFRLLLGKEPKVEEEGRTLGKELEKRGFDEETKTGIRIEVENLELSKESKDAVQLLIDFLKKESVEVRLFDEFLHGKTYIFDDLVVIGSSNFTAAGLTREGELSTWQPSSGAVYTKKEWFNKFWGASRDFKADLIKILEDSRFGSTEYTPYQVYIKALYELQKDEFEDDASTDGKETERGLPESKVNLAEFQEDAVKRVWARLKKYKACMIADSVGLGKTWIAKKILEKIGYYDRKNLLVVCPAQLREMWKRELKRIDVKENILSQEELAGEDFLKKALKAVGGTARDLKNVEVVVIDESHNFRNPLSNRWENLFTLLTGHISNDGKRPYIILMTATPINNTMWDLYYQVMLMVLNDNTAFIKENIPDLTKFFKEAGSNPELLSEILNEISIRRTRDYIVKNYPEAFILVDGPDGNQVEQKIIFPTRVLENVNYSLDRSYKGMYREISDAITEELKMAYYRILQYKHGGVQTEAEKFTLGRMIGIGGIFRTILLKRLESSVEAFRTSIKKHIYFLQKFKEHLKDGKFLTKKALFKYIAWSDEELDEDGLEEIINILEKINLKDYDSERLFKDIDFDINLLNGILKKVQTIRPEDDAKLKVLKEKLLELSKDGQVVVFTYYADTLNYVYEELTKDKQFSKIKFEAISSSGKTSKTPEKRETLIQDFSAGKIRILLSTDVLSEGQNLQSAKHLINYDLHWNPTRMIQRAGRIDRIGSKFPKIFVNNFFPENELEELLRLVEILQEKIIKIDQSIGLDQSVLGESIHPKVFGVIRKIQEKDERIFSEIENDAFCGGEKFYQPLKNFLEREGRAAIEKIPYGIHSGLKKGGVAGIFFYHKYGKDFHFWSLYDVRNGSILTKKGQILSFIACKHDEARIIPDFFEAVYKANEAASKEIEATYSDIYLSRTQDSSLKSFARHKATKFVKTLISRLELDVAAHLDDFPADGRVEKHKEALIEKLLSTPLTKKRLQRLRKIWTEYKGSGNWKKAIGDIDGFLMKKGRLITDPLEPFDKSKIKLVAIDFIS